MNDFATAFVAASLATAALVLGVTAHANGSQGTNVKDGSVAGDDGDSPVMAITADSDVVLSSAGIAGLTDGTAFDRAALRSALPGFDIVAAERSTEGQAYPVFEVSDQGEPLFVILPNSAAGLIGSLAVSSQRVVTQSGHRLGLSFGEVYAGAVPAGCNPGMEEDSGSVFCPSPSAANLIYVFSGDWQGPDGELPDADALQDWTIEAIVWHAR